MDKENPPKDKEAAVDALPLPEENTKVEGVMLSAPPEVGQTAFLAQPTRFTGKSSACEQLGVITVSGGLGSRVSVKTLPETETQT